MSEINKGDIAEGILAVSITARFLLRKTPITKTHIYWLLKKIKKSNLIIKSWSKTTKEQPNRVPLLVKRKIFFNAPNKNKRIKDPTFCSITLNNSNMEALLNPEYLKSNMEDIINAAVFYVNQSFVQKFVRELYENNVINRILVFADGSIEQKSSKADLNLYIDNEHVREISLKTSSAQFGQVSGATYEDMESLFSKLGVKFTLKEKEKIEKFSQIKNSKKVLETAFKYAAKNMQAFNRNKKTRDDFLVKLSDFIFYHATLRKNTVEMVKLDNKKAKVFKFDTVYGNIRDMKFEVKYIPEATMPTIRINSSGSNKKFLGIRSKYTSAGEEKKVTSVIESGELFDVFLRNTYAKEK